jgi:CheY-like chemotaxis protein
MGRAPSGNIRPVHLDIGPVDSASARAWIDNARAVLAGVRRAGEDLPLELPDDVGVAFDRYLDAWEAAARGDDVFLWSDEVDTEQVRRLVVYWFSLLTLDDDTWARFGLPFAPPESDVFYVELQRSVTDALAEADAEVGGTIKASWPDPSVPAKPTLDHARRVAIIDDSKDVRLLLDLALTVDGRFEVVGQAENGAVGVELCRNTDPDAIVLDLEMPDMDGITALPLIRAVCPSARILLYSAVDLPSTVQQAYDAGADAYLVKGCSLDDVVAVLLG